MNATPMEAIETALALFRYNPAADESRRLSFTEISEKHPYAHELADQHTRVADFAEIGYCVYKGWHHGHATPERRTAQAQANVDAGNRLHEADRRRIREKAKGLPKATAEDVRDPFIDIHELPDFPGRVKVGRLTFGAAVDGTARADGNLLIREMKKSKYFGAPDHKLQALAYCLTAPGGMRREDDEFAANEIWWKVHYPTLGRDYGPHPFTQNLYDIILAAMKVYEWLFFAGQRENLEMAGIPPVNPAKCVPCGFRPSCHWQTADN